MLVYRSESIRPILNQLQQFGLYILMRGVLDEECEHFAIFFGHDFVVNGRAAVFHNALEHEQAIVSRMRIGRQHLLFDGLNDIFGSGRNCA